ncbi:hypothetical protein [Aromatoleum anaerobium]|uniref:Uncharacterized protein n=1 Tax=Aromatoleum anaerobium TaxID=182180 RepID=A0ABX1PH99_9RHOO|nr:hypothetical protein [Aromatoleum anaerobium]MCK0509046.1 hypothetical protein [Aromatoleum anaerobium]
MISWAFPLLPDAFCIKIYMPPLETGLVTASAGRLPEGSGVIARRSAQQIRRRIGQS